MEREIVEKMSALGEHFTTYVEDIIEMIARLQIPAAAKILDVGTGSGKMAIILALLGHSVTTGEPEGDHWADWQTSARQMGVLEKIHFKHFQAEHLPFQDNGFDFIFFQGSFHHISGKRQAIAEFLRVISPGGKVVVIEFSEAGINKIKLRHPNHPDAVNVMDYYGGPEAEVVMYSKGDLNFYIFPKS